MCRIRTLGPEDVKLLMADTSKEMLRSHTSMVNSREKPKFPAFMPHRAALEDSIFAQLQLDIPENRTLAPGKLIPADMGTKPRTKFDRFRGSLVQAQSK